MKAPLFLTHRHSLSPVFVPANITEHLRSYHLECVRFIYHSYLKEENIIINNEFGMNEALQICAFLTAVKLRPVLIVCCNSDLPRWQYEFQCRTGFDVAILNAHTNLDLASNAIVLVPHSQIKYVKDLQIKHWSLFVVDSIEKVIKSLVLKNVHAKFKIAVTNHDFLCNQDKNVYGQILKWTKCNDENLEYSWTYPENWLRLTWYTYQHDKPSDADVTEYELAVKKWNSNTNVINNTQTVVKKVCKTNKIIKQIRQRPIRFGNNKTEKKNCTINMINTTCLGNIESDNEIKVKNTTYFKQEFENIVSEFEDSDITLDFVENPILNSLVDCTQKEELNTDLSPTESCYDNNILNSLVEGVFGEKSTTASTETTYVVPESSDDEENPVLNLLLSNS